MKNSIHIRYKLIEPYILKFVFALILMFAMVTTQLYIPTILSSFIDNLSSKVSSSLVFDYTLLTSFCIFSYATLNSLRFYMFDKIGNEVTSDLRNKLFSSLIKREISFFDKKNVGELISRFTSDVEIIKDALTVELAMAIRALLICTGGMIMLFIISPKLTFILIILIPLSLLLAKWLGQKARNYAGELQNNIAKNIQYAQEKLSNIRVIFSNNVEDRTIRNFNDSLDKTLSTYHKNSKLFAIYQFYGTSLSMFSILILVVIGSLSVTHNTMTLGELSSFIIYATMVTGSFGALSSFWGTWMRTVGATDELFSLIYKKSNSPKKGSPANKLIVSKQDLFLDNVSFSYPTRSNILIFDHLNIKFISGEKTAIVGRSGSGKSTIISLILGCYQLKAGRIKLGNHEVSEYGFESYLNSISVVEQEPIIFTGTIADNIKFASLDENVLEEDIKHAAQKAHIHDFIEKLPDGYQTILGDRGAQLSGGQKQRIAIARAFLRNTNILILDEPTSALDNESATLIKQAINELSKNKTTILVAHSLSQIIDADKIIILDEGKVIAEGSHKELIKNNNNAYLYLFSSDIATS